MENKLYEKIAQKKRCLGVLRYVAAAIAEPRLLRRPGVEEVYIPRGDEVKVFGIHAHISLFYVYFFR